MREWIEKALEAGFSHAALVDPKSLSVRKEVRETCADGKCRAYGHNWTCPPNCGTLEECGARINAMTRGLVVQTTGELEDAFDAETMMETERVHLKHFHELGGVLRREYPGVLCLGTGGCRICKSCAYPEPCRFPELACSSMEGYGLLVNDACGAAGLRYYYGKNTITYTACYLIP